MKNKVLALVLAVAVLGSATGITALALDREQNDNPAQAQNMAATATTTDLTTLLGDEAEETDETVYVITGADGAVEKVIVSDWIRESLATSSDAGAATATNAAAADGVRLCDTDGNNIYYQGDIEKELPVDMRISYKLDGKAITAAELAGRSGRVTMRIDYTNNQYETVLVGGQYTKIYVPFVMLTGFVLDNESFTNVEVSNGKLVNDGQRTAVIGYAFPGLQEDLLVSKSKYEFPAYVEISADTTDFRLDTAMTLASNSIFAQVKEDAAGHVDLNQLPDAISQISDAMKQLMDGSSQLYDGLATLLDKSGVLSDGVGELAAGLRTLDSKSAALNDGARQVFQTLLDTANAQLSTSGLTVPTLTISNYNTVLNGVITSLDPDNVVAQATAQAKTQVTAAVIASETDIRAAVTESVHQQVTQQVTAVVRQTVWNGVLSANGLTQESYDAGVAAEMISSEQQSALTTACDETMQSASVQAQISTAVDAQMAGSEAQTAIDTNTEAQKQQIINEKLASPEIQAAINDAAAQAGTGLVSITALKEQLDSYNTFYTGLAAYTDGVAAAKKGATQIKSNMPALISGVKELYDGAGKLENGLNEFNDEAAQKLSDELGGNAATLVERLQATGDVSQRYQSYSGIGANADGQVKFIYRTAAIS